MRKISFLLTSRARLMNKSAGERPWLKLHASDLLSLLSAFVQRCVCEKRKYYALC